MSRGDISFPEVRVALAIHLVAQLPLGEGDKITDAVLVALLREAIGSSLQGVDKFPTLEPCGNLLKYLRNPYQLLGSAIVVEKLNGFVEVSGKQLYFGLDGGRRSEP